MFIHFASEEIVLLGSQYYVEDPVFSLQNCLKYKPRHGRKNRYKA